MDHLEIPFGIEISIRSKFNQKFLGFRHQNQQIASCFPPPNIYSRQKITETLDMALKFRIVSRQNQKNALVTEGSKFYLINSSTEQYLTCTSKGQLKFDKKSLNQEMNKMLFKSASWTISFAIMQKSLSSPSRSPISPYDLIVLKSVYGAYLTVHPHTLNCEAQPQMDEIRSVWNIQSLNSITIPQWFFQKASFSKFLKSDWQVEKTANRQKRNLRTFTPEVQEALLVQDLLDIMLGFQGSYIKHRNGKEASFVIQPHLETPSCNIALAQLTDRILQLPSHYQRLMRFISQLQLKQSTLCQALCDGLRTLINQYQGLAIQLDEEAQKGLTLQMMWFMVQNTLKVMRALNDLVQLATPLKGGQLLTCLLKLLNQNTDDHVINIYRFLFNKLIALYANLLSMWLYEGVIDDRYQQFMIQVEQKPSLEWRQWQQRFSLRIDQIPSLLEHDSQRILVTGKYLNILRACNKQIKHPCAGQIETNLQYHLSKQNFTQPIQKAYDWANQQLKSLIFNECKLNQVLQSLKGYYFLQFGDLFVDLLDNAEEDLSMQKKSKTDMRGRPFSVQKLQNKFQVNARINSSANDPFKEDVSIRLDNATLFQQVHRIKTLESEVFEFDFTQKPFIKKDSRYIDFVTLDFKCGFPLNLILNRKSISKYQCMFRLMLWCKFLQRQLGAYWAKLQSNKQISLKCFHKAYILNSKMLNFIKSIVYYLAEEVVEQNWFKLTNDLKKIKNFEEIIQCHDRFLNNCLKQSLLTNSKLLPLLNVQIGSTINNYFFLKNYLSKIEEELSKIVQSKPVDSKERRDHIKFIRDTLNDLLSQKDFNEFVSVSSATFTDVVRKFIRQITLSTGKEQNHLLRLGQTLDQQNYVQKRGQTYF